MEVRADLHIHSCLSPCGSLENSPAAIARRAAEAGLQAAALTDHNSALNCRAFRQCCIKADILPIFGIEVTSIEEAHILCLFETVEQAERLGKIIYEKLPDIPNLPEVSGDQVFVDADDNILGEVEKFLVSAADLSIDELFELTASMGGMFIPAHIDKPVFSIPSQLGFLPPMNYTAVETVSLPCAVATGGSQLIRNSDAHYIEDIGSRHTIYTAETLSFKEIMEAMKNNLAADGLSPDIL